MRQNCLYEFCKIFVQNVYNLKIIVSNKNNKNLKVEFHGHIIDKHYENLTSFSGLKDNRRLDTPTQLLWIFPIYSYSFEN